MINFVLGAAAVLLGFWIMFSNWWATVDLLRTIVPMIMVIYGVIALMAGLKSIARKRADTGNPSGVPLPPEPGVE